MPLIALIVLGVLGIGAGVANLPPPWPPTDLTLQAPPPAPPVKHKALPVAPMKHRAPVVAPVTPEAPPELPPPPGPVLPQVPFDLNPFTEIKKVEQKAVEKVEKVEQQSIGNWLLWDAIYSAGFLLLGFMCLNGVRSIVTVYKSTHKAR